MHRFRYCLGRWIIGGLMVIGFQTSGFSAEPEPAELRSAISKGISLIEASSKEYLKQRQCFSCHHQAMPLVTLSEARRRGFLIDEDNFQAQVERARRHLEGGKKQYFEGRGQGGRVDTAAWGLWALESGGYAPDETTAAVTHFLLNYQKKLNHWNPPGNRPPTGASRFASSYVALRGLDHFGTSEQQEEIADRRDRIARWLESSDPKDTEDRVYRLRILNYLGTGDEELQPAADDLLKRQNEDGGWSQKDDMPSDAYATGTVLVALYEAGGLEVTDARYQRGIEYLLSTQLDDGSWKVETRSKPIQTYFESGFPHEKSQFVSVAGSSWAVTAMLYAFPEVAIAEKLVRD